MGAAPETSERYMSVPHRGDEVLRTRAELPAMSRLQESIERLYEVFRAYRLGDRIDGCPCCVSDEAKEALHSHPLSELTWEHLTRYSAKAMTTFGTEKDFKHLLPRILELCAREPGGAPYDLSIILGKLSYANWRQWPTREREAVEGYVQALEAALANSDGPPDWDAWDRDEITLGVASIRNGRSS